MNTAYEQREPDQLEGVPPPEYQRAVVGHDAVLADLTGRLEQGRLPGGVLLHGPRGIGKATLAFEVARRAFVATSDETAEHITEQVASGGYPNLFVLRIRTRVTTGRFKTQITVDQIRRPKTPDRDAEPNPLRDRLHQTRGRLGHRVVIIDSIDHCNEDAANALLKILEEPPPQTTFILVSHRPRQLLPTIRSRCHSIAMRPLSDDAVRDVLQLNLPEAAPEAIESAVGFAAGSPRRGLEALLLGDAGKLTALKAWLADPASPGAAAHLSLGDALAARDSADARFARDLVLEWIAEEAKTAGSSRERRRLASANELWEKALALFADTDEYNLDARQTLITIFDAIKRHALTTPAETPEPR